MKSRRIPEEKAATSDEIEAAILALTAEDMNRLDRAARFRIAALGDSCRGRDHEDLLQEAVTRTLTGQRRWNNEDVDFIRHVLEVIRSIAWEWRTRGKRRGDSKLLAVDPEILDDLRSEVPDPERRAEARQLLEAIETMISPESEAQDLLAALQIGLTGPEIEDYLGMTTNARLAAMKRLRRCAKAAKKTSGGQDNVR